MNNSTPVAISFDDVMLAPQFSTVVSRSDVDLSVQLAPHLKLSIPIISSNMDTVTGPRMVRAMDKAGGIGVLHRFADFDTQVEWLEDVISPETKNQRQIVYGISTGMVSNWTELGRLIFEYQPDLVALDVAYGNHVSVVKWIEEYMGWGRDVSLGLPPLMAGNVATYEGAMRLLDAGATIIKVGIGPGSACTTRLETGHGVPQLSAIRGVRNAIHDSGQKASLVADGGIRTSGDIVKALAAGADAVMLGGLLAGTDEAPGEIIQKPDGSRYKHFRGSASFAAKDATGRSTNHIEGSERLEPYKGQVRRVLDGLTDGIRSGLSYSGAHTIKELQEKAKFIGVQNARNVGV